MNELVQKLVAHSRASIEAHNPARIGHAERVSSYAVATAYELGIRDRELLTIRCAAALHEIGKQTIRRETLEYPGELTESQLDEVRRSCVQGGLLVKRMSDASPLFVACGDAIAFQYARFDGDGFFEGIAGDSLPLAARVLHVCTAFDVMTTDQPWKQARSEEDAARELLDGSGAQFDPAAVTAFLRVQPLIQPLSER